ncbi:MAG: DUF2179 domain-containing protein [Deltaproteobacteria bacterium]|nr:DUF2179 domain-containing protein [Candidatus Zymogenaceae bacterium]
MFADFPFWQYAGIPLLICLARICDVTLGTIRIMYVARGIKVLAAILGFFEVLIWLFAIGQIISNLTNVVNYFAYAVGYALGNYIGITIEEKLSVGVLMLRIITKKKGDKVVDVLRKAGFGITAIDAKGIYGPVQVIFTVINRKDLGGAVEIIKRHNPQAVYSVQDVRSVSTSPFPQINGDERTMRRLMSGLMQRK